MARRLTALVAPVLAVAGCASDPGDANPSPGDGGAADVTPDPNPFTPSAPLDAKYGSLSDEEAKNWCLEFDAWLRREFDAARTERYWRGSCLNSGEFEGRSFPETFLSTCETSRASCLKRSSSLSPAEDWSFPDCDLVERRKSCPDTPTVGELSRCATHKLRWRVDFSLDFAPMGPARNRGLVSPWRTAHVASLPPLRSSAKRLHRRRTVRQSTEPACSSS
jgi:hypothetical protein